jgi:nucleoside-diphosphate-sugar epimerase
MAAVVLRAPWILSPDEMRALARSGGVDAIDFRLYHYIDARDLAQACRLAVERPLTGCQILFVGSGETIVREPLSELYPRLVPEIAELARKLSGTTAPVSIARAKRTLNWAPHRSWRRNPDGQ